MKWGFCKKSGIGRGFVKKWTFPQRRVYCVQYQYFLCYILLIWGGVRTHPTHPPCLRAWRRSMVGSRHSVAFVRCLRWCLRTRRWQVRVVRWPGARRAATTAVSWVTRCGASRAARWNSAVAMRACCWETTARIPSPPPVGALNQDISVAPCTDSDSDQSKWNDTLYMYIVWAYIVFYFVDF